MDPGVAETFAGHKSRVGVGVLVVVVLVAAALGVVAGRWLTDIRTDGPVLVSADHADAGPLASDALARPTHPDGMSRSEMVMRGLLQAAPECQPAVEMSGAPIAIGGEFLQEARGLASAKSEAGYENVSFRVKQSGERVYGVLYYEECT
jgi:hypothetical protein